MAHTEISFGDGLAKVKSNASGTREDFDVGGVYNLRTRKFSTATSHDIKGGFLADEKAVPKEDEDSGLRKEGDYKLKQVRRFVHPHSATFPTTK